MVGAAPGSIHPAWTPRRYHDHAYPTPHLCRKVGRMLARWPRCAVVPKWDPVQRPMRERAKPSSRCPNLLASSSCSNSTRASLDSSMRGGGTDRDVRKCLYYVAFRNLKGRMYMLKLPRPKIIKKLCGDSLLRLRLKNTKIRAMSCQLIYLY